jgi:hypothetical protein
MNRSRIVPTVIVSSLLALTLSSCGPFGPGEPPASPPPPATGSGTPTPDSTSSEPPAALAAECTELLDAASVAEFEAGTFGVPTAASLAEYVDKIRGEGSPLALFVDGGGLLCPITNGTRVSEIFGFSPITAEVADAQKARLLSEGFALSTHLGGELYSDTRMNDDVVFEFFFLGDYWFCAIDVERLDEVVANSGAPL